MVANYDRNARRIVTSITSCVVIIRCKQDLCYLRYHAWYNLNQFEKDFSRFYTLLLNLKMNKIE